MIPQPCPSQGGPILRDASVQIFPSATMVYKGWVKNEKGVGQCGTTVRVEAQKQIALDPLTKQY